MMFVLFFVFMFFVLIDAGCHSQHHFWGNLLSGILCILNKVMILDDDKALLPKNVVKLDNQPVKERAPWNSSVCGQGGVSV